MSTLSLMPGDNFKIGDYVYIVKKIGTDKQGGTNTNFKKKLSTQDRINIKLGIPFDKVCPDSINGWLYKIKRIDKYDFDNELIKEEDFEKML